MTDGTQTGGAREPDADPAQEHRERRIWWAVVGVGLLVMVAVMVLLWPVMRGRLDAARQLDDATASIAQAQNGVELIDIVVNSEINTETVAAAIDASPTIPVLRNRLATALALVNDGYPHLTEGEQRRANLLKAAATARIAMLDTAPVILSASARAGTAIPLVQEGWEKALVADRATRGAAIEYNKHTAAGAKAASRLNAQAAAGFLEAKALFSQAATTFPEANLEPYTAFLTQRLKQVTLSQQSDAALAAGDTARANALIVAYNAEDAKSVAMVAQLPAFPAKTIADAYQSATEGANAAYQKARNQAREAESALKAL